MSSPDLLMTDIPLELQHQNAPQPLISSHYTAEDGAPATYRLYQLPDGGYLATWERPSYSSHRLPISPFSKNPSHMFVYALPCKDPQGTQFQPVNPQDQTQIRSIIDFLQPAYGYDTQTMLQNSANGRDPTQPILLTSPSLAPNKPTQIELRLTRPPGFHG